MKVNPVVYTILLLLLKLNGLCQQKTDSICFDKDIADYSIDVSGNIFISLEGGSITKYSPGLDSLITYSPTKIGDIDLLEAGNGLRIFAFYDLFQEYLLTDRFLARPTRSKISGTSLNYVQIATQSQDNNIWLIENTGLRMVKYNVSIGVIEIETALSSILDSDNSSFTYIREYQNMVFLVDHNSGIYVFDNLGNFLRKINAKTAKCSFHGNNMLYLENNKLVIKDLYSLSKIEKELNTNDVWGALMSNNSYYLVRTRCLIKTK